MMITDMTTFMQHAVVGAVAHCSDCLGAVEHDTESIRSEVQDVRLVLAEVTWANPLHWTPSVLLEDLPGVFDDVKITLSDTISLAEPLDLSRVPQILYSEQGMHEMQRQPAIVEPAPAAGYARGMDILRKRWAPARAVPSRIACNQPPHRVPPHIVLPRVLRHPAPLAARALCSGLGLAHAPVPCVAGWVGAHGVHMGARGHSGCCSCSMHARFSMVVVRCRH